MIKCCRSSEDNVRAFEKFSMIKRRHNSESWPIINKKSNNGNFRWTNYATFSEPSMPAMIWAPW